MKHNFNQNWTFWSIKCPDLKIVNVPHDAMISEKREADAAGGSSSAFFPGGQYFYEKEFDVDQQWLSQHITFEFEGVYKNAKVTINGREAGGAAYGYIPFFVCADGLLKAGKNIIRVETDNMNQPDSRWYSGAGIFRPVWLHVQEKVHIDLDGIQIQTLSVSPACVRVRTTHTGGVVSVEIMDGETTIASGKGDNIEIELPKATLWCETTPKLYTARIVLELDNKKIEIRDEQFGIREIGWNKKGLFVNGKETLLRGGCVHHDNGILGACSFSISEERRIRILKENGFNAIRSSHNPCSKAMLEACDKYGLYVIDELWDMWYKHKNKYDYAEEFTQHYKYDMKALVQRDFNHPSVIFYSIGNEVSEPAEKKGVALAREMTDYIRSLDCTRAVVGGFNLMIIANAAKGQGIYKDEGGRNESGQKEMMNMNSTMFNMITARVGSDMNQSANDDAADEITTPVLDIVDIAGYNYASGRYPIEGEKHPDRLIFGSETFPQDLAKNWGMVEEFPYLIGDFMWTAWDYLGEAGIGAWAYTKDAMSFEKPYPWLLADTGAFDILGNPNGEAMLAKTIWIRNNVPLIGVRPLNHEESDLIKAAWRGTNAIPSWSWSDCEGKNAVVEIYSVSEQVELFLNGKSFGKKMPEEYVAVYEIPYKPGKLEAIAYDETGTACGRNDLVSANDNLQLVVTPENKSATEGEIVYIDIAIADINGVVESNHDTLLEIEVKNCTLIAFGSANPRTEERFDSGKCTTYYGKSQAIILAENVGTAEITVKGKDLPSAIGTVKVSRKGEIPS